MLQLVMDVGCPEVSDIFYDRVTVLYLMNTLRFFAYQRGYEETIATGQMTHDLEHVRAREAIKRLFVVCQLNV